MKVALVYDRINKWGGAESVLLALHEIFPDAPLYTSVYDKKLTPWADVFDVHTSWIQKTPLPKNKHEYYPFFMGMAFESLSFDQYDLVISITHEFAKAIITKPSTMHICYCLTPASYLWSGYDAYFGSRGETFKELSRPLVNYLRFYDKIICHRPDKYIAISQTVQERIKRYYGLDSDIIYPPVDVNHPEQKQLADSTDKYYLVVSRLVPNKKLEIVIESFNQTNLPLHIVGVGKQTNKLKKMATSRNIKFLGGLNAEELSKQYAFCQGLIVPGNEDFGIVSVEAQSYGKPVLAFRRGGSTETVIEGKTGFFFDDQSSKSLTNLIVSAILSRIKPTDCRQNAKRYSKEKFKQDFKSLVENSYQHYRQNYV